MPKVICTLENASSEISGVKFTPHPDGGAVSEEISDDQAAAFVAITGYALVEEAQPAGKPTAAAAKPPAAPAKPAKSAGKAAAPAPVVAPPAPDADPVVPDAGEATADVTTAPAPPAGDDETTF